MKYLLLISIFSLLYFSVNAQVPGDPDWENDWGFINTIDGFDLGSHLGAISAPSMDTVYLTAKEGIFYRSYDGGATWSSTDSNTETDFVDMEFYNRDIGFAVGLNGAIVKTTDAGVNWTSLNSGTSSNLTSIAINNLNDIWIVGEDGHVLHSTNQGSTWNDNTSITDKRLNSIAFQNDSTAYIAGNDGTFLKTSDNGQTWNLISVDTDDDLFSLSVTENNIYMLKGFASLGESNGFKLLSYSESSGWSSKDLGYNGDIVSHIAFENDSTGYYICGTTYMCDCCDATIEKTEDYGVTWEWNFFHSSSSNPCINNDGFAKISLIDTTGYAFQGNHVLKLHGGGSAPYYLGIEKFEKTTIKIYPNPAEDHIYIDFDQVNPEKLSLVVFDLQGRKVLQAQVNSKKTELDLSSLTSGRYFLKLFKHGKTVETKSFIKK